jgi:hypothetical protein
MIIFERLTIKFVFDNFSYGQVIYYFIIFKYVILHLEY